MAKKKEPTFEDDLTRLEEIVTQLEEGPPTLGETLTLFEEGVALAKRLEATLAEAETKVRLLLRDEDGHLAEVDDDEGAP